MIFHYHILNTRKSLLYGGCLRDDVNAVNILFNHFPQSPDLPLDYLEPANDFLFVVHVYNGFSIYPLGVLSILTMGIRTNMEDV